MEGQGTNQPAETVKSLDDVADLIDDNIDAETEEEAGEAESEEEQGEELEGEEDEAEESEEESDDEAQTETLIHEGKEVKLKKSEVLELAQKGFDYTKKTMALAEERKALEPLKAQVTERLTQQEQALSETIARLNTAAEFIESELGAPPSIELASYDAATYLAQKEAYESRVAKLRNTYGQLQYLSEQQNQLRQSQLLEQANETERYLVEHLPGWKDAPEKSLQELNAYIKEYGLSPETAKEAYVQKGLWELAHKAREYDRLQSRKAELKPKASLPKVNKPSANHEPANAKRQEAFKRFNKKPSLESLADLL